MALLLHLRMTGRLLWSDEEKPFPPSTRLLMGFDTGRLLLIDPRRFATLSVRPFADYAGLGRDPLSGIKAEDLRGQAGSRRLPIKNFLMDQRFIAGIGNIYACEILHQAGIDPYRSTGSLRKAEWAKVVESMGTVLLRAVACRGTSISDWRDLFGIPGTHQDHLRVYSREGMPCPGCGQAIVRGKLNGRGTWHCPACQR